MYLYVHVFPLTFLQRTQLDHDEHFPFISPSRSPLKSNNLIGSERWPYRVKADTDWNPRRWLWTYKGGMEAVLLGKHEKNILLGNAILLTRTSVWFGIVLLWTCYCYMKLSIGNTHGTWNYFILTHSLTWLA